ncbi:MAG: YncE family protein [Bacteroidota bacterium]|jgi:DNA-binding beta-propeller fold protein YncE
MHKKYFYFSFIFSFFHATLFSACAEGNQPQAEHRTEQAPKDSVSEPVYKSNGVFKELKLVRVIQSKNAFVSNELTVYERAINSPKSVIYSKDGSKFYIHSLEGHTTVVFDSKTLNKLKEIYHDFNETNGHLFKNGESTVFDYTFRQERNHYNHFKGKPVESCLSHGGKYLWVTYYRRDWDPKAVSPSAVAIIDTKTDEIVRVMPSGPLPKMIACSGDNKCIAITHWGDNTVGLIDISSENPMDFKYTSLVVVDYRLNMSSMESEDRDAACGNCLRGTVFTPDHKKILIAKMGGNGIAVIDVERGEHIGTITGSYTNLRHLVINNGDVFLSSNKFGMVQRASLDSILSGEFNESKISVFKNWRTVNVGSGARTIDVTDDGKYIFACINNGCKVAVVDAETMKKVFEIDAAAFPVGMSLSPDGKQLVITSQGKTTAPGTGNTATVFEVIYENQQ